MGKRYHETPPLGYNERSILKAQRVKFILKPISLNQLLIQPKTASLSFFLPALKKEENATSWETFYQDMVEQLILQEKIEIVKLLVKAKSGVRKAMKSHPDKGHAFFFSEQVQGYSMMNGNIEAFCMIGSRFHVRPMLEEVLMNPEFILVDVSLHDIRVYRVDALHVEMIQHYEFDDYSSREAASRVYNPQYLGMIPHKTLLAIKTIARKVMDMTLYDSLPVVVTGLEVMKKHFTKNFRDEVAVISHFDEDFFEKTCVEIFEKTQKMRPVIMDYYSARMKERLKRMQKSKKIVTNLEQIVKSVAAGKVIHLVLPSERKLMGKIDLEQGTVEVHKKAQRKNPSVDIINELAEEVIRQGGKIEFLGTNYFPDDSEMVAILKGA